MLATSWMNLYLGLVAGLVAGLALFGVAWTGVRSRTWPESSRNLVLAVVASAVAVSPLFVWQWMLLFGGPSLGTPEKFLSERAALDGFTLAPFAWNRLEPHRALNAVAVGLAILGVARSWKDARVRFALFAGLVLFLVSIGPVLLPGPVPNPVYMGLRAVVPGFWRVAKPEVFFHATWLLILCVAAIELCARTRRAGLGLVYLLFVGTWVVMVRTHPAYPPMTMPVESRLAPDWEERVFR